MANVTNETKNNMLEKMRVIYMLAAVFALVLLDLILDIVTGASFREFLFDFMLEGTILITVVLTVRYIWLKFSTEKDSRAVIERDLKELSFEFRENINRHFVSWKLSSSEKDIALLLLMGKQTKEIASKRFTSDRTIRNQCHSIYEKSGCSNRNGLSAYFFKQFIS